MVSYFSYGVSKANIHGTVKGLTADVPLQNDGTLPAITMTSMADVAKYVAALCELPQGEWKEDSYVAGGTHNMSSVIHLIEKVRGSKMKVTKYTKQALTEQIDAIAPDNEERAMNRFFLQLTRTFADGEKGWTVMEPELNTMFPHIRPMSVEEYMNQYWAEK
jgi:hypothetical protein